MIKGFDPTELLATVERLLATQAPRSTRLTKHQSGPEEILAQLSMLMDRELYSTTIERTELQTICKT
jgi:hypothetical protein